MRARQQPEALQRVDRVHRDLEWEVDVVLLEQHDRLVDDQLAFVQRQRAGGLEEIGELHGCR